MAFSGTMLFQAAHRLRASAYRAVLPLSVTVLFQAAHRLRASAYRTVLPLSGTMLFSPAKTLQMSIMPVPKVIGIKSVSTPRIMH